jgi:DNA-binding NarL/FixJ family response regulator
MKKNPTIKIIIADDHAFFRSGLASVLNDNDRYYLVDEASNGKELLEKVDQHLPDLIIIDVVMPEMDGMEVTRRISKKYPLMKIIALTAFDEDAVMVNMLKAGAHSFLDKNINKTEVYRTIDEVMQTKGFYFPKEIAKKASLLMEDEIEYKRGGFKNDFSDREMEIIILACRDFSIKETAEHLGISPRTVEVHRSRIMERMEVKSVAGIVAYAFQHQLYMRKDLKLKTQ